MSRPADRVRRLPKWAQQELALMDQRLNEARAELERVRGSQPTRIMVDPDRLHSGDAAYYAQDKATVRFMLGDDWQDYIDVALDNHPSFGHAILLRGGRLGINVHPQSGNVVDVSLRG